MNNWKGSRFSAERNRNTGGWIWAVTHVSEFLFEGNLFNRTSLNKSLIVVCFLGGFDA